MKIFWLRDEEKRVARTPEPGSTLVIVTGACPLCGDALFRVRGGEPHPSADDRAVEAQAQTVCCKTLCGRLRVEVSTVFGVSEDARVLDGPWKVY